MRRFAEAVMLCHEHNHPHVMLLQIANSFYKLPGNWLKHDEEEIEGVQRILDELFEPDSTVGPTEQKWEIGDAVGVWWRPNFETSLYPYLPAHVTRPKEAKKMYMIPLPQNSMSSNVKILGVEAFRTNEVEQKSLRYQRTSNFSRFLSTSCMRTRRRMDPSWLRYRITWRNTDSSAWMRMVMWLRSHPVGRRRVIQMALSKKRAWSPSSERKERKTA